MNNDGKAFCVVDAEGFFYEYRTLNIEVNVKFRILILKQYLLLEVIIRYSIFDIRYSIFDIPFLFIIALF
jgi:hypothetical protein